MRRSEDKRKHVRSVAGLLSIGVLLVSAASTGTAAASPSYGAASFSASGSVQQVQVTGADPGKQLTLIDRHRHRGRLPEGQLARRDRVPQREARLGLSGAPGQRRASCSRQPHRAVRAARRHRAGASTTRRCPGLRLDERLRLSDHARRHQAGDQRAAARTGRQGPLPDLVEYSGYGYADPAGGPQLDRPDRQAARLRGGRREHARHRLLRRRVRLLRAGSRASTATTWSRRSPASPGSCITRSG